MEEHKEYSQIGFLLLVVMVAALASAAVIMLNISLKIVPLIGGIIALVCIGKVIHIANVNRINKVPGF